MKTIFFLLALSLASFAYSQGIPDLAKRTLTGKLTPEDFEKSSKYMVNVDTTRWGQETLSGDIVYYNDVKDIVNRLNHVFTKFKNSKEDGFVVITNNPIIQPRKQHWVMVYGKYRIEWWFSTSGTDKLETITLSKIV